MSVLCDVGVYVRSMYMSGRHVCEINVYVNILVTRADVCAIVFRNFGLVKNVDIRFGYQFNLGIIKPWSFV